MGVNFWDSAYESGNVPWDPGPYDRRFPHSAGRHALPAGRFELAVDRGVFHLHTSPAEQEVRRAVEPAFEILRLAVVLARVSPAVKPFCVGYTFPAMSELEAWVEGIRANVRKVIYGKDEVVDLLLIALVCGGHVLLEDVPGVGKTILARALAASLGFQMKRLQCTPDLMPADVIGVSVYNQRSSDFEFREGPVMTNILLVDEINRASPRTQSALLEAMEEGAITVEGSSRRLPRPFFIIATENPVEFEGTFPLPVAQKDRFFLSASMGYPSAEAEKEIMEAHRRTSHPVEDLQAVSDAAAFERARRAVAAIAVPDEVAGYILDLVAATRRSPSFSLGASPRAARALYRGAKARAAFSGRPEAGVGDVRALVEPVMWKRIAPATDSLLRGMDERRLIGEALREVASPQPAGSAG